MEYTQENIARCASAILSPYADHLLQVIASLEKDWPEGWDSYEDFVRDVMAGNDMMNAGLLDLDDH